MNILEELGYVQFCMDQMISNIGISTEWENIHNMLIHLWLSITKSVLYEVSVLKHCLGHQSVQKTVVFDDGLAPDQRQVISQSGCMIYVYKFSDHRYTLYPRETDYLGS